MSGGLITLPRLSTSTQMVFVASNYTFRLGMGALPLGIPSVSVCLYMKLNIILNKIIDLFRN